MADKAAHFIGVTLGDLGGSGPAALSRLLTERAALPPLAIFGPKQTLKAHGCDLDFPVVENAKDLAGMDRHPTGGQSTGGHPVVLVDTPYSGEIRVGERYDDSAPAVIALLNAGVDAALAGHIRALTTGPIHKASLYSAGFSHPGHTEFLAAKAGLGGDDVVMMLASNDMRVVPLTIHIPLHAVSKALTTDLIIRKSLITYRALQSAFGIEKPRLALAGLNPHAGEDGSIGHEEATRIQPALWALEDMGIKIDGPQSADTMFHEDARKTYDAALCCYHDQALIPIKTLDIWGGVNVTLGLPFVRTSPDHGTAFGAVKEGVLKAESLLASIRYADKMTHRD